MLQGSIHTALQRERKFYVCPELVQCVTSFGTPRPLLQIDVNHCAVRRPSLLTKARCSDCVSHVMIHDLPVLKSLKGNKHNFFATFNFYNAHRLRYFSWSDERGRPTKSHNRPNEMGKIQMKF
jgi:hypothetical protein